MAEKVKCTICDRTFKNQEGLDAHNEIKHPKPKEKKSNRKKPSKGLFIFLGVIAVIILLVILLSGGSGKYETFAECTAQNGAKMFGAYWCPHCNDQKDLFGSKSFKKVNYIECSLPNRGGQTAECNAEGIQSYPTWEFADGERITGVLTLEQLSSITGCPLTIDE